MSAFGRYGFAEDTPRLTAGDQRQPLARTQQGRAPQTRPRSNLLRNSNFDLRTSYGAALAGGVTPFSRR